MRRLNPVKRLSPPEGAREDPVQPSRGPLYLDGAWNHADASICRGLSGLNTNLPKHKHARSISISTPSAHWAGQGGETTVRVPRPSFQSAIFFGSVILSHCRSSTLERRCSCPSLSTRGRSGQRGRGGGRSATKQLKVWVASQTPNQLDKTGEIPLWWKYNSTVWLSADPPSLPIIKIFPVT